ncbi:hypothetical protein EON83_00790 [bacterium]|nr:MAG: hypothetical protein EON83_00790 [bacterium]
MTLKKSVLAVASLALLGSVAQAQESKPLNISQVPVRADAPILFAPRGWKIEKQVSGDLNHDKVSDAALVLIENKPAKGADGDPSDRRRALVVLVREGKGWHRVGFSANLLMGTRDGGAFFGAVETPVTVVITRAGLIVKMEAGSREVATTTHRFRYESKLGGIYWIGFDSVTRDRAIGDVTSISINFLTGVKRTSIVKGGSNKKVTTTSRVSTKLRALHTLTEDDRYSS